MDIYPYDQFAKHLWKRKLLWVSIEFFLTKNSMTSIWSSSQKPLNPIGIKIQEIEIDLTISLASIDPKVYQLKLVPIRLMVLLISLAKFVQ